uniref:Uncharacterized protein n=1 Tax=Arundo donax TaxID=35708 RepID=A0A0A8Z2R9_ARUDO
MRCETAGRRRGRGGRRCSALAAGGFRPESASNNSRCFSSLSTVF